MQFSLVAGQRTTPSPKLPGICPACGEATISKCGSQVVWHWAHRGRKHCDQWWENETPWHRQWKELFPEAWREHVYVDRHGERHVADVRTESGIVLEFQNSPIPPDELRSREDFYGRMTWIVNGARFANQFFILGRLPSPDAEFVNDIEFFEQKVAAQGRLFWWRSENTRADGGLVQVHSMADIQHLVDAEYVGHHLYDWLRPRTVWLSSGKSVLIDFGGDVLWELQSFGERNLRCVRALRKASLVSKHGGTYLETGSVERGASRPRPPMSPIYRGEDELLLEAVH